MTRLLFLVALLPGAPVLAVSLDPAVLPKVQAATFEVVLPKADESTVTYEKPLPLDLLPFQFRNDKYVSIGTAFAVSDGHFVTAFHVFAAGIDSVSGAPALRDSGGHVYAIDQITRFSPQEDFVEFTVRDAPKVKPLAINRNAPLNDVVFAVGNALGTGVVIRDGLYTSDTPEEQDGRWKWMRFSAAASPGNSGGPLLDKSGKLVGVVLAKSPGENLNYALPINRVLDASTTKADIDRRENYVLDIMDDAQTGNFRGSIPLPIAYPDFMATYLKQYNAFIEGQLKALLAKSADTLYPRGSGSHRLLVDSQDMDTFPSIIRRSAGGTWNRVGAEHGTDRLADNGYLELGASGKNMLFHLRKPDSVSSVSLYGDPKLMMDLLLKGTPLNRDVGNQKIKILSLGKPVSDELHVDRYGRRWYMRVFALPYMNGIIVIAALPVPDGYIAIARMASASDRHAHSIDLEAMTDFVSVGYGGRFSQWKEFLSSKAPLPDALRDTTLSVDYDKRFDFTSKPIQIQFGPNLQKIQPDSKLVVAFAVVPDGDNYAMRVGGVVAAAEAAKRDMVLVSRYAKPFDDSEESDKTAWQRILKREHPLDRVPYTDSDVSFVGAVVGAPSPSPAASPDHLYSVTIAVEGTHPPTALKDKLNTAMKGLTTDNQ
ncbi:S1 family peptidase [Luteibacter rhizovicinus]|nr:serine protease [Luteibacter rhizovicinus]